MAIGLLLVIFSSRIGNAIRAALSVSTSASICARRGGEERNKLNFPFQFCCALYRRTAFEWKSKLELIDFGITMPDSLDRVPSPCAF